MTSFSSEVIVNFTNFRLLILFQTLPTTLFEVDGVVGLELWLLAWDVELLFVPPVELLVVLSVRARRNRSTKAYSCIARSLTFLSLLCDSMSDRINEALLDHLSLNI